MAKWLTPLAGGGPPTKIVIKTPVYSIDWVGFLCVRSGYVHPPFDAHLQGHDLHQLPPRRVGPDTHRPAAENHLLARASHPQTAQPMPSSPSQPSRPSPPPT